MANRGRKRELGADLFEVNAETKEAESRAECKVCKAVNKSRRNFSYKRHYLNFHRKEAIEIGLIDEEDAVRPEPKLKKIKVRMDQETYEKSVVDLVSVHGLSLRTLNSPAMRNLMNPYEKAFNIPEINSVSVKPMLSDMAGEVKSKIIREVAGKFVCLKLDIATRLDRDMLGINIQFMKRKKQVIRTLGMVQLKRRHTAKVIKEEVMKVLRSCGIDLESVYSITTDNGSNMLLTSEMVEVDLNELLEELHEESSSENEDEENDEKLQRDEDEEFDRTDEIRNIFSAIRCAAHTAQLAVLDTLKESNTRKHIASIKHFVKNLRKMPYKNMLKSDNINKPVLSCDTRWNSAYAMAKSLQDNKLYISNMTKNDKVCHLSESEWEFIEVFVHAFKPMAVLTNSLQAQQLTLGDFYILWFRCKLALKKQNDGMSVKLLQNMEKREPSLLNNKAVLAAAYVDQRINYKNSPIFDDDQRAAALRHLKLVLKRIIQRKGDNSDATQGGPSSGQQLNTEDPLEEFLVDHENSFEQTQSGSTLEKLENLSQKLRLKLADNQNIIEYWFEEASKDEEMWELVSVVLSSPATQVSVERSFSALAFILSKLRSRLSEQTLHNILMVRLNIELLH